jgi:hypothetical protein
MSAAIRTGCLPIARENASTRSVTAAAVGPSAAPPRAVVTGDTLSGGIGQIAGRIMAGGSIKGTYDHKYSRLPKSSHVMPGFPVRERA